MKVNLFIYYHLYFYIACRSPIFYAIVTRFSSGILNKFEKDTWDDEAHQLYQGILWDAFREFWYVSDTYDASDSYNVTFNKIWNKNSPNGITDGGKILLLYEVRYEVIDSKYDII